MCICTQQKLKIFLIYDNLFESEKKIFLKSNFGIYRTSKI